MSIRTDEYIKGNEDCVLKPYPCSEGYLTIGWGHNLDAHGITQEIADLIFWEDFNRVLTQVTDSISFFDKLYLAFKSCNSISGDTISSKGWPTHFTLTCLSSYNSRSKSNRTSMRSTNLAILVSRHRLHAQTCGLIYQITGIPF